MLSLNPLSSAASAASARATSTPNFLLSDLLTVRQVHENLNVSRMTLYRIMAADPTFPPQIRIGRAVRIRAADLSDWIAQQEVRK